MNKKFSLIEILVVVAVIGILVSLLAPSLANARDKGRSAVCQSNLKQIFNNRVCGTASVQQPRSEKKRLTACAARERAGACNKSWRLIAFTKISFCVCNESASSSRVAVGKREEGNPLRAVATSRT